MRRRRGRGGRQSDEGFSHRQPLTISRPQASLSVVLQMPTRKRKALSEEELELRRRRREEAAAKRVKLQEEAKKKQQEQKLRKK